MERFSDRWVDEAGKIKLPQTVLKKEEWVKGTKLVLTQVGKLGILQPAHVAAGPYYEEVVIDELGRISASIDIRDELQWYVGDVVSVYYLSKGIVVIKKYYD